MSNERVPLHGLQVARPLADFVNRELLPRLELQADTFWRAFAAIITELSPRNRELLALRDSLQQQIDDWYRQHQGHPVDAVQYRRFLKEIGYLLDPGASLQGRIAGQD